MGIVIVDSAFVTLFFTGILFNNSTAEEVSDQAMLTRNVKAISSTAMDIDDYLIQEVQELNNLDYGISKQPQLKPTTVAWWVTVKTAQETEFTTAEPTFSPMDSLKNMSMDDLFKISSDREYFNKTVMEHLIFMYGFPKMEAYPMVAEALLDYLRDLTVKIAKKTQPTRAAELTTMTLMSDYLDTSSGNFKPPQSGWPTLSPSEEETNIGRILTPRFLSSPPTITTTTISVDATYEVTRTFPIIQTLPPIHSIKEGGPPHLPTTLHPSNLLEGFVSEEPPTTEHPMILKVKENMNLLKFGYCTTFFYHLFEIIAHKDHSHTRDLIRALEMTANKVQASGRLANMYTLESTLMRFIGHLGGYQPDMLASLASYLKELLQQKERLLSEDTNYVLSKIDALYNKEEGKELLELLVQIHDYPQNNMSPDEITENFVNNIITPYGKINGPEVIELIRKVLYNKLISRRNNKNCKGTCVENDFRDVIGEIFRAHGANKTGKGLRYVNSQKREKKHQTDAGKKVINESSVKLHLPISPIQHKNLTKYPNKHHTMRYLTKKPWLSNNTVEKLRSRTNKKYKGLPIETEREFVSIIESDSEMEIEGEIESTTKRKHKDTGIFTFTKGKVKKPYRSSRGSTSRIRSDSGSSSSESESISERDSSSSFTSMSRHTKDRVRKHLKLKHPQLYKKYKQRHRNNKQKKYKFAVPEPQPQDKGLQNLQRRFRIIRTARKGLENSQKYKGEKQSKYLTPKYDFTYRKIKQANFNRYNLRRNNNETKFLKESSYSDYEADLKFNLQDAIRHPHPIVRNNTEHFRGYLQDGRRRGLLDESSYSDHEAILKSNIYKVLNNKH